MRLKSGFAKYGPLVLIVLTFAVLFFYGLEKIPVANTDDAIYAQIASNVAKGELFPLQYNGIDYFDAKPPLLFWVLGGMAQVFGDHLMVYRCVGVFSVLLAMSFLFLTVLSLTKDRWIAILSALLLVSSQEVFSVGRRILTDGPTLAALCLFLWGWISLKRERSKVFLCAVSLFFVFMFRFLVVLYPLLSLLFVWAFQKEASQRRNAKQIVILVLLLIGAWFGLAYAFGGEAWLHAKWHPWSRLLRGEVIAGHSQTLTSFLVKGVWDSPGLLVLLLVGLVSLGGQKKRETSFNSHVLLVWIGFGTLSVFISSTRMFRYLLPVYPALITWGCLRLSQIRWKWTKFIPLFVGILFFVMQFPAHQNAQTIPFSNPGLREVILRANELNVKNRNIYLLNIYFAQPVYYSKAPVKEILLNRKVYDEMRKNQDLKNSTLLEYRDYLSLRKAWELGEMSWLVVTREDFLNLMKGWKAKVAFRSNNYLLLERGPNPISSLSNHPWASNAYVYNGFYRFAMGEYDEADMEIQEFFSQKGFLTPEQCVQKTYLESLKSKIRFDPQKCLVGNVEKLKMRFKRTAQVFKQSGFLKAAKVFETAAKGDFLK